MLTEQWFLRQAWRRSAGLPEEREPTPRPDLPALQQSQWSSEFESLMRHRLLMGAFRYGTFDEQKHARRNNPEGIERHLREYLETGNAEHLVDIANLALVEFVRPSHKNFHFKSIDDGQHHTALAK
jgi:hypothetical protein